MDICIYTTMMHTLYLYTVTYTYPSLYTQYHFLIKFWYSEYCMWLHSINVHHRRRFETECWSQNEDWIWHSQLLLFQLRDKHDDAISTPSSIWATTTKMGLQRLITLLGYSWRRKRHERDKGGVDGIYLAFDYLAFDYICMFWVIFDLHTSWHPFLPSRNWGLLGNSLSLQLKMIRNWGFT